MQQYLNLTKLAMEEGVRKENRTGIDTWSYFGAFFRHNLQDGFPLLTTKKMHTRSIFTELCWFLKGMTNIQYLKDHKVTIWDEWADKDGEVDAGYGQMWRAFPTLERKCSACLEANCETPGHEGYQVYLPDTFDQMAWAVERLKTHPMDRRIVISAWLPPKATKGRMAPCHYTFVFNVTPKTIVTCEKCGGQFLLSPWANPADYIGDRPKVFAVCSLCHADRDLWKTTVETKNFLNLHWTQRSCDIALGVPFNIASYAALCHIIAKEVGMEPGILAGSFVDFHIYTKKPDGSQAEFDHVPGLQEQLTREPLALPTLKIVGDRPWHEVEPENLVVEGYRSHPAIPFKVAV